MKIVFQGNVPFKVVNGNLKDKKGSSEVQSERIQTHAAELPYREMYFALAKMQKMPLNNAKHFSYENYDNAEKLFRENLKNGEPLFGDEKNVPYLLSSDKVRRNLIEFLPKYAQEELDKIKIVDLTDRQQIEKMQSLVEVRNFFNEFKEVWPLENKKSPKSLNSGFLPQVSFAGNMTSNDEKACKNVVHVFSAACGLVSAAMGEGAAVGADTVPLRMLQFLMFSKMAMYLKVPPIPSLEYYTKEMFTGATLGVGGAKLITSWLGIGAHAASVGTGTTLATGGGADAAITGSVRAVNSSLSFLITEKMGRGYVNRVKNNQMTFKHQTFETAAYFIGRGLLTQENPFSQFFEVDFADTSSPELIKDALEKLPACSQEAFTAFLKLSQEFTNRTGTYFAIGVAQDLLFMKDRSADKVKQHIGPIFKNALLSATIYEICDFTVGQEITKETTEAIKDMQENLEKYPDVFKKFIELEHEFYQQINLEDLGKDGFVRQFKNRAFVNNFSNFSNYAVSELAHAWRNRKNKMQAEEMLKTSQDLQSEQAKGEAIKGQISPEEARDLAESIAKFNKIFEQQKQFIELKDNFGYGRIGGYEDTKDLLTQKFILPVSLENTNLQMNVPPAILFYGPTGVGKTQLARALSEQAKCLIPRYVPSDDKEELKNELEEKKKSALENYETKGRRTVFIIDEFDDYGKDPELAKLFEDFIKTCSDNKITLMLTTNKPNDIPESILKQVVKVPISPPNKNNAVEVMKFYLKGKVGDDFDLNTLTDKLFVENKNGAYSNSQIKLLCERAHKDSVKNDTTITVENMLELIKKLPPEIDEDALEEFKSEISHLGQK